MPVSKQELTQVTEALERISIAMEQLQIRYDDSQRTTRRVRLALMITLLLFSAALYHAFTPIVELVTQVQQIIPRSKAPTALEAKSLSESRKYLMESLSPDDRAQIELFEQQQKWVSNYIASNPNFNTGAVVALVLSRMSQAVQVMPELYDEIRTMTNEVRSMNANMQAMNGKMDALPLLAADIKVMRIQMSSLPVLANEVNEMSYSMSIMTRDINSTMGKAGRIMPW